MNDDSYRIISTQLSKTDFAFLEIYLKEQGISRYSFLKKLVHDKLEELRGEVK